MQDIPEEIAAHCDTSCWNSGKPRLPGSSCLYLEVDHGPAAESLANKAKGESSQTCDIVPELHSSDQDPSPKVMAGKGLDESLETNSPATQSASEIGQRSRHKSGRSILPLQKHLRRFKEDYLVSASARSFRYGGLSWSTRLKLWLKDLVD